MLQSSQHVMNAMQQKLARKEKEILLEVYEHCEMTDGEDGLSKKEFESYWTQLPSGYVQRWKAMDTTFEDLAGSDGILDWQEFRKLLDQFAEDENEVVAAKPINNELILRILLLLRLNNL